MATLPDGASSITNMYFWQPIAGSFYAPCVDGDYDQGVIGHEFSHMIENRMIGKGNTRAGFQAGAMGEAFGDLVSTEYLHENNFTPTDGEDPFATGTYATGNKVHGIRNYVMNWPRTGAFPTPSTFPHVNPLNFSDIGYDVAGNEVHADGEIWVAINNSVRQGLIDKYDGDFPAGNTALQAPVRRRRAAFGELPGQPALDPARVRLVPARPDRTDHDRRAQLDARGRHDAVRRGEPGRDLAGLRTARARRERVPEPGPRGRKSLPELRRRIATRCRTSARRSSRTSRSPSTSSRSRRVTRPVNAKVYVGHYEGRASQIADTDPATTNSGSVINNDATAHFAPGHYDFLVVGKGHGFFRFSANLKEGLPVTLTARMPLNVASAFAGATASGDGTGQGARDRRDRDDQLVG